MSAVKKVFLAGIIQGSEHGKGIHDQDYRNRLKAVLRRALPGADVYCPIENHPESVEYDEERARRVFLEHVAKAGDADIVVAYLPQASMGTAIEIWQAYERGRVILTISPLADNWVIRLLSTLNFASLDEFESFVDSGRLAELIDEHGK